MSTEQTDPSFADLAAYRAGQVEAPAEAPAVEAPAETPAETPVEAPVEAPAAAAETPEAEAPEGAEPDPASEAGRALAGKRRTLQSRIDELTAARSAAERRAQQLEAELAAARGPQPGAQPAPAAGEVVSEYKRIMALPGAPKVDQFDSYEEYTAAASLFVTDVRMSEHATRQQQEAAGRAVVEARDRVEATIKAAHPDFDTVIEAFAGGGNVYHPTVAEFILQHPDGHEIAYRLAKDPALNTRIASIGHPGAIVFELGRLLAAPVAAAPVVPPVSKAPRPVSTVGGSGAEVAGSPDPAKISSVAEWNKIRNRF